jgi:hypothetical protein
MSLLDADGKPVAPSGFKEFSEIYNGLLTGEREPQSPREKIIWQSIQRVHEIIAELEAPLDMLTLAFWSWIAVYQWVEHRLNESGKKGAEKLDTLLRQMVVQLTYDAWESMSELTEEDLGQTDADAVPSEAPLSIIP